MEKAGTVTDPYKIREAMFSVVPRPHDLTVIGAERFIPEGDTVFPMVTGQFRNGELVIVE